MLVREIPDQLGTVILRTLTYAGCRHLDSVELTPDRRKLAFGFYFDFEAWKGDWSITEYALAMKAVVRARADRKIRWVGSNNDFDVVLDGFKIQIASVRQSESVEQNVDRLLETIGELHSEAERRLTAVARDGSVVVHFHFHEPVRAPCEQYLVYFADFLRDLGVKADTELKSDAGDVLFAVTPNDPAEALGRIRQALNIYLRLPTSPISAAPPDDFASQRLLANVHHLESQIALARAVMHAQRATIEAQETTIFNQQKALTGSVVFDSVVSDDREDVFGGTLTLTKYEGKGFEINLPELFRKLRSVPRLSVIGPPPNYCPKLTRPGFGPPAEPAASSQAWRRHGGCSSAGVACNFSPATAAPHWLRHVGPGRAA